MNWTGGIMIQEVKPGFDTNSLEIQRMLPLYERNKIRSLKVDTPETLNTIHICSQVGPKFPLGSSFYSAHSKQHRLLKLHPRVSCLVNCPSGGKQWIKATYCRVYWLCMSHWLQTPSKIYQLLHPNQPTFYRLLSHKGAA